MACGHGEQVADASWPVSRLLRQLLGKKLHTSSTVNRPSCTAKPMAVEVKLLLKEKSMWGRSGP